MDSQTRLHYLQAMGIDSWILRQSDSVEAQPSVIEEKITESKSIVYQQPEPAVDISTPLPELDRNLVWDELKQQVAGCQSCELCQTRTQTVFGSGNQNADWMVIGEAPGFHEDQQGQPFVGAAGSLLTEMLRAVGLSRDQVYIANIIKCRPPNNRDPQPDEIRSCHDFLKRQIALIQPKIILSVGRISAQTLLNSGDSLGKLRGRVHDYQGIPLVVVYHPAYLLRSLLEKRKAWQDLKLALKQVSLD